MTSDRIPPKLSTGSVVSLTWLGTKTIAITSATPTSGSVTRKTEPHQKCSRSSSGDQRPERRDPPPSADQSAIDFVRPGPDQSAVISARVVG